MDIFCVGDIDTSLLCLSFRHDNTQNLSCVSKTNVYAVVSTVTPKNCFGEYRGLYLPDGNIIVIYSSFVTAKIGQVKDSWYNISAKRKWYIFF